jgi:alpha-tubulin suppressor-like RCC1 family protein
MGQPARVRTPTSVPTSGRAKQLDSGQSSTCAVLVDGTLECWGAGAEQHFGNGSDATLWSPQAVVPGFVWHAVALETFHTCAIDEQQRLYCWGRSVEGQLGLGRNDALTPQATQVPGGPWRAVSAGRFYSCAISTDSRIWCTGANADGELGLGDSDRRNVFTEVALP